jgi:hypothetical protein
MKSFSAGDGKLFAPIPILNVDVETSTLYTFALTTTLPVGELTVIPEPEDLFTDVTDESDVTVYNSLKLFCTF